MKSFKKTRRACAEMFDDVSTQRAFVKIEGHEDFTSIIIAPIISAAGELLGVVCLDATKSGQYGEEDVLVVSLAASLISLWWSGKPPAAG